MPTYDFRALRTAGFIPKSYFTEKRKAIQAEMNAISVLRYLPADIERFMRFLESIAQELREYGLNRFAAATIDDYVQKMVSHARYARNRWKRLIDAINAQRSNTPED